MYAYVKQERNKRQETKQLQIKTNPRLPRIQSSPVPADVSQLFLPHNSFTDFNFLTVIAGPVRAYRGDLIVCLVDFENIDTQSRVPIRFTLNGTLIHEAKMKYVEREKELHPLIRMFHKGTCVLAKVRAIFCNTLK